MQLKVSTGNQRIKTLILIIPDYYLKYIEAHQLKRVENTDQKARVQYLPMPHFFIYYQDMKGIFHRFDVWLIKH